MTKRALLILIVGISVAAILYAAKQQRLAAAHQQRDELRLILQKLNLPKVTASCSTHPKAWLVGEVHTEQEHAALHAELVSKYTMAEVDRLLRKVHLYTNDGG